MDRDEIIATLRAMEPDLKAQGIEHLALFGSVARGDAGPDSDVDLLATVGREAVSLLDIIRIGRELGETLGRKVDLYSGEVTNLFRKAMIEREMAAIF
ncbi:MAG: nucleotidyltransferase domain-containing protein [Pseudomonadota bacterium]